MGRPKKYITEKEAREARLASKRQYYTRYALLRIGSSYIIHYWNYVIIGIVKNNKRKH